ncbi:MAG: glutamate--tRNA ligase [Candidatus Pacebacteria bacterium]|nr:glutamate--tRNA ligase [Candidatus Paceibacterota bacterium]
MGLLNKKQIRTRFAPSPTGNLHIGSARTALFNYLFARKNRGEFILRIEDTDKERSKIEYEEDIIDGLKWLGLNWDSFYRQSERKDIYRKYLEKLLDEKKAYYCFCRKEELEAKRQEQISRGAAPKYNGKCASLSEDEAEERIKKGDEYVIRFKIPAKKIKFNDLIRGAVEFDSSLIGDMVIAKDLDNPLYNFTVTIDDFEMKITHILRGEDLLPNTPKQIILQEALGFTQPIYAHLPLILGPDKSKLSKRHGAESLSEYRRQGYLEETLVNFLSFLGWNPGTEKEIFSLSSLIKEFSIDKVQKSGAVFNIKRLDYLNGFYIRQKPLDKLTELCMPYLIEADLITPVFETQERLPNLTGIFGKEIVSGYNMKETGEKIDFNCLKRIISIYQERIKRLSEVPELVDFFFKENLVYEKKLLFWKNTEIGELIIILEKLKEIVSQIEEKDWNSKKLEDILISESDKISLELKNVKDRGYLIWPFRAAITGKESSAPPFVVSEILGRKKTIKRIENAINLIKR